MTDIADYVIIGAGSAGCVLANRLSADPQRKVVLIEGGDEDTSPLIHMPRGFGRMLGDPKFVWTYTAKRGGGANEPEYWVRGKTLGGSSSVNGMVYVRGQPSDYDSWAEAGCTGWGWADMAPCFRAIEDHELGASENRGAGGALKITNHPRPTPLCDAVLSAAADLGVPIKDDLNTLDQEGVGYHQRSIWKGRRQSAAVAFLAPIRSRSNLRVLTNCIALGVVFERRRAIGVRVRAGGEEHVVLGREIILSCGALNSPQLLQLSGIGPADLLTRMGVAVVHDAPDVGANMREHRLLSLQFRLSRGSENAQFQGLRLLGNAAKYGLLRRGPLANAAFEVGGFIRADENAQRPDAQIMMGPFSLARGVERFAMEKEHGAICGGYVMRPESRGTVAISGPTVEAPLNIDPNYLSTDRDRRISAAIVRKIRAIFANARMASFAPVETSPGSAVQTDDEIVDAYHRLGASGYHAAGTCRMGADAQSVVDTSLRVRGVDGLRVVDISIMPHLVSGNTNAPAMAIGWRAADLILKA
ncbi:MAG: GMC family oxidoreductase [Caulobacterales bacterium]